MAQLDIHYRNSPAIFPAHMSKTIIKGVPQSGDFLPVIPLLLEGQHTPVSSLAFLSAQHTLFLYVDEDMSPADRVALYALLERVPQEFLGEVQLVLLYRENLPKSLQDMGEFNVQFAKDIEGKWLQRLGKDSVFLLRPDGYLAFSGNLSQSTKLLQWMKDYFLYQSEGM